MFEDVTKPASRGFMRALSARTMIGLLLVALSVVGVLAVLHFGHQSIRVYRATAPLTAGEAVDASMLEAVEVQLGQVSGSYLREGELPSEGAVATRTIGAGELVPREALGAPDTDRATVIVSVEGSLPAAAVAGATVELWASPKATTGKKDVSPRVLVEDATVIRVTQDESMIAGLGKQEVELRVPRGTVAAVLEAQGQDARLSLVPLYTGVN